MSAQKSLPLFPKGYKKRLIICILIPVIITLLLYAAMNSHYLSQIKQESLAKCLGTHSAFSENCEHFCEGLYRNLWRNGSGLHPNICPSC